MTGPLTRLKGRAVESEEIERICSGCPKRHTKPGTQPAHLARIISQIHELDELKAAGATFAYPHTLTIWEWAGLRTLERERGKQRMKEIDKSRSNSTGQSEEARMRARLGHKTSGTRY